MSKAPTSLTKSALSGVAWNYAGVGVLVVAQVASTVVTARLIDPTGFGSYAAAQAAIGLGGYFTLQTLSLTIMRRKELGSKTVGSAFALSATASLAVSSMLWFASGVWANLWHNNAAARLVQVMAFALLFTSLSSVPIALVRRRLRFRAAAMAEVGSQVCGMTLSIVLAVFLHSATALALGQVCAGVVLFVWAATLAREDFRFGVSRAEMRDHLGYGSQLSVLYLCAYSSATLPQFYVNRVFGSFMLGIYSRAYMIVNIPLTYLASSVNKVLFPLFTRVRDDTARTKSLISEGLILAAGFSWPAFAFIGGAASVVVDVLLGHRWHQGITLLRLTAVIAAGSFPMGLLSNAAEALKWMRFAFFRQFALLSLLATAIAANRIFDLSIVELLAGIAIAQWAVFAIMLPTFSRRGVIDLRLVVRSHIVQGAVSVFVFGIAFVCGEVLASTGLWLQVVAELVVAMLIGAILLRSRSWYPATRILASRFRTILPAGSPWIARLRLAPPQ